MYSQSISQAHACNAKTQEKKRERERERERERKTTNQPTQPTTKTTHTKKHALEPDLDVAEGQDVRVEQHERGQDEETLGEMQTGEVCISPAPERGERAKNNGDDKQPTQREERETQTYNHERGQVLKGTLTNTQLAPETK